MREAFYIILPVRAKITTMSKGSPTPPDGYSPLHCCTAMWKGADQHQDQMINNRVLIVSLS
jgi:hypothetical protein